MPTYEFACDVAECGAVKTVICPVAKKPKEVICPHCGKPMEQIYYPVGQVFKGRGWTPHLGPIGSRGKNDSKK